MSGTAAKFMLYVIIGALAVCVLVYAHGEFIRECMASGNTKTYCEYQFWRR